MLDQDRPRCGICGDSINATETLLDYTPFGIGYSHENLCEREARELAYSQLAKDWGLEPVDGQCLHGVGKSWTYEEFEWHDFWDCKLQGLMPYPCLDHVRMWIVKEGSPWSSITAPGLKILTSEPYLPAAQPIPSDSWLWYELGSKFQMFRYDDVAIHRPAVDGSGRTVLHVWARSDVGDTKARRELRNAANQQPRYPRPNV